MLKSEKYLAGEPDNLVPLFNQDLFEMDQGAVKFGVALAMAS